MSTHTENFSNPLLFDSFTELLVALFRVVTVMAIPIVVFFLIYSGFLYVTARGNPENIKKASRALLYAVIGGVVIIGAEVIMVIVENLVNEF